MIDEKCWADAHLMSVLTSRPQVECYEKLIQERKTVDLESQLHQEREKRQQLTKLLESLTPGGTEFYNDPDRCVQWVKDRLAIVSEQVKKRQQAEADNAALMEAMNKAKHRLENSFLLAALDILKFALSEPHPGAALLEEVERLRKENANYKDIVGLSCEEYRIHRETIEQYKEALILACEELVRHAGGSPFADSTWRQHFLAKAKEAE